MQTTCAAVIEADLDHTPQMECDSYIIVRFDMSLFRLDFPLYLDTGESEVDCWHFRAVDFRTESVVASNLVWS